MKNYYFRWVRNGDSFAVLELSLIEAEDFDTATKHFLELHPNTRYIAREEQL
jgi:hypothetical protein